jgi:hypothetical protein
MASKKKKKTSLSDYHRLVANLIRYAISGNHWTFVDLDAYNIRISTVDTEEFFGVPLLPAPTVDPIILDNVDPPVGTHLPRNAHLFFRFLRNVFTSESPPGQIGGPATEEDTSPIIVFSFHILRSLLQFTKPDRMMLSCNVVRFFVSTEEVKAKLDLALLDSDNRILLILEERVSSSPIATHHFLTPTKNPSPQDQPEPRLVAKALAAFQIETRSDHTAAGLPPVLSKTYIGIVMDWSTPRFYKITITQALSDAVACGLFPAKETIVQRFIPPVPDAWGMLSLEDRRVCFQCFEALKSLL